MWTKTKHNEITMKDNSSTIKVDMQDPVQESEMVSWLMQMYDIDLEPDEIAEAIELSDKYYEEDIEDLVNCKTICESILSIIHNVECRETIIDEIEKIYVSNGWKERFGNRE